MSIGRSASWKRDGYFFSAPFCFANIYIYIHQIVLVWCRVYLQSITRIHTYIYIYVENRHDTKMHQQWQRRIRFTIYIYSRESVTRRIRFESETEFSSSFLLVSRFNGKLIQCDAIVFRTFAAAKKRRLSVRTNNFWYGIGERYTLTRAWFPSWIFFNWIMRFWLEFHLYFFSLILSLDDCYSCDIKYRWMDECMDGIGRRR